MRILWRRPTSSAAERSCGSGPSFRLRTRRTAAAALLAVVASVACNAKVAVADTRTHTVRSGESLSLIARRYGVSVADIESTNRSQVGRKRSIRVGARLRLTTPDPRTRLPEAIRLRPERLRLRPVIRYWAEKNSIPPDLVEATLFLESGWNQQRISSTGAIGVGQLMPETSTFIKSTLIGAKAGGTSLDERVVEDNIRMSARYLRFLLRLHNGDVTAALHSYYQGAGSVAARGIYDETHNYAAAVQALRGRFRGDLAGASSVMAR